MTKTMNNNIILYTTNDGKAMVELYEFGENLYLAQSAIAKLFATSKQNVSLHIQNILKDGELHEDSVVKECLITAKGGKSYNTKFYSLEMILAIGFRVRSKRGVQFRIWANEHLRKYLQKGFLIDNEKLKKLSDDFVPKFTPQIKEILSQKRVDKIHLK